MREILFRGKRCDNGEWVQGYYIRADHHWHNHGIHKDWITLGASANGGWSALHNKYAVKDETVCQFTGLTDKNGKKIFEGDLCLCNRNINSGVDKQVFHINFDTEYGQWVGDSWSSNITADEFFMCEIIGNIHDNPELLENP